MTGKRFQEIRQGAVTVVIEWRTVKDHPDYEITRDGVMRKAKSGKVLADAVGNFRYRVDGVRKSVAIKKLRNKAFPELGAW